MGKFMDLTGQKFGRLIVVERAENYKSGDARFKCKCDCGNEIIVASQRLKNGRSKSCGCLQKELTIKRSLTHGMTSTRVFRIWIDVKRRCVNPRTKNYKHYGARGITVCEEWKNDFMAFYNWSISNGYQENLTIDRIDVNGNYEPNNCRWATTKEQNANKTTARLIEFNGRTQYLFQWSTETGINSATILSRIRDGWSIEKALTTPVKKHNKQKTP